ncbi:MFS transporter [Reinekea marina]|uniref:MFS transporter n=1 Tax=Reinekea marina TaxID=1310421 RepID=A0ABV7WR54_9GAMM|nr:MFS transporter [Reinekea marina]MDN3648236.1 MFS transporter [Reinekea marina]
MPPMIALIAAYAFAMCSTPLIILVGGLIGQELAPDPRLATLPISIIVVATALSTAPAAMLMQKIGRKKGFLVGFALGGAATLLCLAGLYLQSFILFVTGCFMTGTNMAFVHQFRFAAMELVPMEKKSQAASWVLIGGIFAAVAGPEAGAFGRDLFAIPFTGSFVILMAFLLIAALIIATSYQSEKPVSQEEKQTALVSDIAWLNPTLLLAFATAAISYSVMSLVMTAAPLSMSHHGHDLQTTKWVLQSHILAMFVPSLFTGKLLALFGYVKFIVVGVFIYIAMALLGLAGYHAMHYWGALLLLGVGWNLLFISGTTLLGRISDGPERFRIQAVNEFLVFGTQALASLGAGWLLYQLGWRPLLLATLPLALIPLVFLILHQRAQAQTKAA